MKKKIFIGIGAFLIFGVIAITIGILNGKSQGLSMDDMITKNTEDIKETDTQSKDTNSEISEEEAMDIAMEQLKEKVKDAQPNTSAMVDKIALQARDDAKSIDSAKTDEAISYIRDNYPDYFTDNATMEKAMYYGYLLEYAYKKTDNKNYTDLGMDTYQAIKYVYRGAETVEDTATQENLKQIEDTLNKLN